MGSPPVDGGRHRMHEPDIGAPRTIMFTTGLPDRDIDQLTVQIPAPRAALDPPTEVIRQVVVPPQLDGDQYWDDFAVQEAHYAERPASTGRGGRWGVVLGALVVTGCAAYIAVAGIGGLRGGAVGPATSAGAIVTATFPASAVPPAAVETTRATSVVPAKRPARTSTPVTTAPPVVSPTPAPTAVAEQETTVRSEAPEDVAPLMSAPPKEEPAEPGSGPQPRTGPAPAPPPSSSAPRP